MSNCPGIRISELGTMVMVGEGDYIVINDNNAITKRIGFADFVGSLNANPNVRLTTYAKDVIILSPNGSNNQLWLRIAGQYPQNQEVANNYLLAEVVKQKDRLTALDVRLTTLETTKGNYVTKSYVDQQIAIERTLREAADSQLMNVKADKYNVYTKVEVDQLLDELVLDGGGIPDAPSDGKAYARKDEAWIVTIVDAPADGNMYVRQDNNWVLTPDGVTNLGLDNHTDETLEITSDTGDNVTIPAATTVLAGLMTAADKAALTAASAGTDLGLDNRDEDSLDITSSTGNPVIVPAATTALAGLMTAADKTNLDDLVATGGETNLATENITTTTLDVTSSTGTDATIPAATTTTAGLLTAQDKSDLDTLVATGGETNLGIANKTATTLDVTSSTGTDATLPEATQTEAGLMSASDKTDLDDLVAIGGATDLGVDNRDRNTLDITSSTGTDVTVPSATNDAAGLMTADQATKLDGIADGAEVNVATDLAFENRTSTSADVTSSTGTDATLATATDLLAGLMSAADKDKLDHLTRTVDFQGGVDLTGTDIPTVNEDGNALQDGDAWLNNTLGNCSPEWAAVTDLDAGDNVTPGDLVIYNGTDFNYIPTGGIQYTDEDVDAHLNTGSSTDGQILSYTSGDYQWVDQFTGDYDDLTNKPGLQQVLTTGNVSNQSIELTNGNDIIHISPTENRLVIGGSSTSATPTFELANYDGGDDHDNKFYLTLADGSTSVDFKSSGGITTYDFHFNANDPRIIFRSGGSAYFKGSVTLGGNESTPNINLTNAGEIEAGSIEFTKNWSSQRSGSRGIVYSQSKKALLSTNRPNAESDSVDVFLARTDNTSYDADGNRTPVNVSTATSFKAESPFGNSSSEYGTYASYVGFHATNNGVDPNNNAVWTGEDNCYGFLSGVAARPLNGKETYGFYSAGNAPNYYTGTVYIGGTTTRNTRQLWESTLTEEQKEQLAAGTLAIPANVSTPGDGSFFRQWWYDQQSAEDQALIDSGEIEYPERLLPANFNDSFVLGDNTAINLLSSGRGDFSGGIKITGGQRQNARPGIRGINANNGLEFIANDGNFQWYNQNDDIVASQQGPLGTLKPEVGWGRSVNNSPLAPTGVVAGFRATGAVPTGFSTTHGLNGFTSNVGINDNCTVNEIVSFLSSPSSSGTAGSTVTDLKHFEARGGTANPDNTYGFYSSVTKGTGTNAWNFYAANSDKNYFGGEVGIGGTDDAVNIQLNGNGSAIFTGTVSGVTPSLDPHLTTKAYVDAAIAAGGGSGGGAADLQTVTDLGNTTTNGATFGGDVGIGTDSPAAKLHTVGSDNEILKLENSGNTFQGIGFYGTGDALKGRIKTSTVNSNVYIEADPSDLSVTSSINFSVDGTERAQITSDGSLGIGGTLPGSPNITLSANGDANLTGNVYSGGNPNAGAANGARLLPQGQIYVSNATANANLWRGYTTGNATWTSEINNDGSASFGSGNITLSADGKAAFNGNVAIGATAASSKISLRIRNDITGAATSDGVLVEGEVQPDVTNTAYYFRTVASTEASAFTASDLIHVNASQGTFGAGSTVTNQYGFRADNSLNGATNNYGFYSHLTANGLTDWNFYAAGTAPNFFEGDTYIGGTAGASNIAMNADGSASFVGKVTSDATESGDGGTTLTTKDYVDAAITGAAADLQTVTDLGNTTTNNIVINDKITLQANGTITTTNNIVINDKITLQSNGTINGTSANIGNLTFNAQKISTDGTALVLQPPADKDILFKTGAPNSLYKFFKSDESARGDLRFNQLTANRSYTFPDAGGTIALTSDIPGEYVLPTASDSVLGGIKVGARLTIDGDGVLSADIQGGGGTTVGTLQEVTDEGNTTDNPATFASLTTTSGNYLSDTGLNLKCGGTGIMTFKTKNVNSDYRFFTADESNYGNLRFNDLTGNYTFTFPNKAGTVALTSDITGSGASFKGATDVTGTPPSGSVAGDLWVNTVAGNATNAWTGIDGEAVALNQMVFYVNDTGSGSAGWVLGGITDESQYVTLGTNQTISGDKTFTGTTVIDNITINSSTISGSAAIILESGGTSGMTFKTKNTNSDYNFYTADGSFYGKLRFKDLTSNRTYTLPDLGGTIALTSDIPSTANFVTLDTDQSISGAKTFTVPQSFASGSTDQGAIATNNQVQISRSGAAGYVANLSYGRLAGSNNYGFQISALNNNIPADILIAPDGGNVTVGTTITIGGTDITSTSGPLNLVSTSGQVNFKSGNSDSKYKFFRTGETTGGIFQFSNLTQNRTYTWPDKNGTVAMTSDLPTTPDLQAVTDAGNTTTNAANFGTVTAGDNSTKYVKAYSNGQLWTKYASSEVTATTSAFKLEDENGTTFNIKGDGSIGLGGADVNNDPNITLAADGKVTAANFDIDALDPLP